MYWQRRQSGTWARACDCKYDRSWSRIPLKEINNLIFIFLRSAVSVDAKRGVKYRHSPCISLEFGEKIKNETEVSNLMGTECLETRFSGSLCLPFYPGEQDSVKLTNICICPGRNCQVIKVLLDLID